MSNEKNKRKILFFINKLAAGGAERVMSLLISYASKEGYQVFLVTGCNIIEYDIPKSVKHIVIGEERSSNRVIAALQYLWRLRRAIKSFSPDIVLSFITKSNMYATVASIGTHARCIVSERNSPSSETPGNINQWIRNQVYRFADGLIFQTQEACDEFPKYIKNKGIVIPNPVKDGLPYADREHTEPIIVAIGRLDYQKNYPLLLRSFANFLLSKPHYEMHIYGKGPLENELKSMVKNYGIEKSIIFKGVSLHIHDKIRNAAMYVLSSDYEGISNALLESLAMGLPCISTDCPCGGSRLLIRNGENGILVPVGNEEALTKAMLQISSDGVLAEKLGNNAKLCRELYSTEKITRDYFRFISSLIL